MKPSNNGAMMRDIQWVSPHLSERHGRSNPPAVTEEDHLSEARTIMTYALCVKSIYPYICLLSLSLYPRRPIRKKNTHVYAPHVLDQEEKN
jgi:hypothetical protein